MSVISQSLKLTVQGGAGSEVQLVFFIGGKSFISPGVKKIHVFGGIFFILPSFFRDTRFLPVYYEIKKSERI